MATHSSTLAGKNPMDREAYSPWGRKESDTTEQLHNQISILKHTFQSEKQVQKRDKTGAGKAGCHCDNPA